MTRQINLYNPALRIKRQALTARRLLGGLGVMVLLVAGYASVLRWQSAQLSNESKAVAATLQQRQEELARVSGELGQRRVSKPVEAQLAKAESMLKGREQVSKALESGALGSSQGFSEFLRAFARQTAPGLWLTGLQITEGGRTVTLEGRTLNPDLIPGYIKMLNMEPALRGRSFEALNIRLAADDKTENRAGPGGTAPAAPNQGPSDAARPIPYHEFALNATGEKSSPIRAVQAAAAAEARQ